ncbi:MAG: COX15/CtaA family protein [Sphingomicrobium sp.]|nr:COX15/CtaA family protein [Sphingomonadales bacterium]
MDAALLSPTDSAAPQTRSRPDAIAHWLLLIAALVFAMVVVGGITRLTESGLSITEWKPISGALPPLGHADWLAEFARYQATPQYRQVSGPAGMTLGDFQFIYFWEWVHRLLARLIGVAFALPLLWFAVRREIPRGYGWRLIALFALGGFQGALGWYMVQSGLVNRTEVSHFRLSAHLLSALLILGGCLWTALDLKQLAANGENRPARLTVFGLGALAAVSVQIMLGAWVAGLRAGQVASSWPLMNDHFLPEGIDWSSGALFAFTHDPFLIHFVHRWWAWGVVAVLVLFSRHVKAAGGRCASIAIHSAFGTQILLGIATVMSGVAIGLAVAHQAVGALLLAATVWGAHVVGRPLPEREAGAMQRNRPMRSHR